MGQDPTHHCKSDLFPTAQQASPSAADRVSFAQERRHVLPKDLPNAVKHLNDEELDRLLVVTLAEAKRGADRRRTFRRMNLYPIDLHDRKNPAKTGAWKRQRCL